MKGYRGMRRLIVSIAAIGLVTGCSDNGVNPSNNTELEIASEAIEVERKAGQWEMTSEFLDVKIEGNSKNSTAIAERMKGRKSTVKICLTEEQIKNTREDMLKMNSDANCEYKKFSMEGGKLEAEISCPAPQKVDATITGEFDETTLVTTSHIVMHDLKAGTTMDTTKKMTGKWIGKCDS